MNLKKFALIAVCLVAVAAVLSAGCISTEDSPRQVISLSSTIGPVDAGIIPALEDAYMEKNPNVVIRHIKAGTGATIDTAKTNDIVDFELSINTQQEYTHYWLDFPNADMQLVASGNYLITIYQDGDMNNEVAHVCFSVVEPLVDIHANIRANTDMLFDGQTVLATAFYRVMRNADLDIDEDEAEDLLKEIETQVRRRRFGEIIRLEVQDDIDSDLLKYIVDELEVDEADIFSVNGPIDLTFLSKLTSACKGKHPELCYKAHDPAEAASFDVPVSELDIFEQIREKDRIVHHPYETFDPVLEFVKQAARAPNVLSIKQTLYRVSDRSPIIASLLEAAQNGKQVMVLVELKARFDEENNINWAKKLENAGCHVIYGLVGLKTHCKITLVVRKEEEGIRRYVHLG